MRPHEAHGYEITIQGSRVSLWRVDPPDSKAAPRDTARRRAPGPRGKPNPDTKLHKKDKRQRSTLVKTLAALENQGSIFATLCLDKAALPDQPLPFIKAQVDNLGRAIRSKFPQAWFLWVLEPHDDGVPHVHLIGDIQDEEQWPLIDLIDETWRRLVGSGWDRLVDLRASCEEHIGYLAKKTTPLVAARFVKDLGAGRRFGFIGKANAPIAEEKRVRLTTEEADLIRSILADELHYQAATFKEGEVNERQLRRIEECECLMHGFTRPEAMEKIKAIMGGARGRKSNDIGGDDTLSNAKGAEPSAAPPPVTATPAGPSRPHAP